MKYEQQLQLADVLEGQTRLNTSVGKALASLSLQADRYDDELREIREGMAALSNRIAALSSAEPTATSDELRFLNARMEKLTQAVAALMTPNDYARHFGHSVKVEP